MADTTIVAQSMSALSWRIPNRAFTLVGRLSIDSNKHGCVSINTNTFLKFYFLGFSSNKCTTVNYCKTKTHECCCIFGSTPIVTGGKLAHVDANANNDRSKFLLKTTTMRGEQSLQHCRISESLQIIAKVKKNHTCIGQQKKPQNEQSLQELGVLFVG